MRFTLRQLEYAVAVARHLNFHKAAQSCHVSQPSLSAQLAQLETALGEKLFERGARGVTLTPFGGDFLPRAREVLEGAALLEDLARAGREPLSGELRIGIIPTVAPFLLPATMPLLAERHPRARLYLVERPTAELVEMTLEGRLDVAVVALEAELGRLDVLPLFRDPFLLATHVEHPLAEAGGVSLADVPHDELLLLEEEHCLARQIAEACKLERAGDLHDFRASSLTTLVHMVALGMGLTLLPRLAERSDLGRAEGVRLVPLADEPYRTIGLAWRPACPRAPELALLGDVFEEAAPE